jgi:hypothetical protein
VIFLIATNCFVSKPEFLIMKQAIIRNMVMFLAAFFVATLSAQRIDFSVQLLPVSSSVNDEFAPVFYKEGLVFCSNSLSNASIQSDEGRLFNLLYVAQKDSGFWKSPELFSKEITTILNEGPATFSSDGSRVFFARNNLIEGKFKDINVPSNTMGIYEAQLVNGAWTNIKPFPFNSPEYSLGTPAYSEYENRLYFAADMPGGYGGTDIYYANYVSGEWQQPINLGSALNTAGNESYPFIDRTGRLFFASDGLPGLGGKDIYYSVETTNGFKPPIHLGTEINSSADDYGLVTDVNFEMGYFSSNRKHSEDIYIFKSEMPQFGYCDTLLPHVSCFVFYDERFTDTLHLEYEWNFGKGIRKSGYQVEHCFNKPGNYEILLTITHNLADSTFQTKSVHRFTVQVDDAFIAYAPDFVSLHQKASFITAIENFNEFKPREAYWDFGKGYTPSDTNTAYTFTAAGKTLVSYGIEGVQDAYGRQPRKCYTKQLNVLESNQHYAMEWRKENTVGYNSIKFISSGEQFEDSIKTRQAEEAYLLDFLVLTDSLSILDADALEKALNSFSKQLVYTTANRLDKQSIETISQIAGLMEAYSSETIALGVHSAKRGNSRIINEETNQLAKDILAIFNSYGISKNRIQAQGYGNNLPRAETKDKKIRYRNNRIEFIILSKSN